MATRRQNLNGTDVFGKALQHQPPRGPQKGQIVKGGDSTKGYTIRAGRFEGWRVTGDFQRCLQVMEVLSNYRVQSPDDPVHVAVLANGPSLTDTWPNADPGRYDWVVAVNTAAWLYPCDWHGFLDRHIWDPDTKKFPMASVHEPLMGYLTQASMQVKPGSAKVVLPRYGEKATKDTFADPTHMGSLNLTFPLVMHFAQVLANGGNVDVYGFDCSAGQDVVGKGGNRKAARWFKELHWLRTVWGPNVTSMGRASDEVIQFLLGDIDSKALSRVFNFSIHHAR